MTRSDRTSSVTPHRLLGRASAPVVVVMGGISADRYVSDFMDGSGRMRRGWWSEQVGPSRAIDLTRWRVLSFDYLQEDGVTPRHQADTLFRLLEELDIGPLHAVVGASYGGAVALEFAARYPERSRGVLVLGSAHRPHPMATAVRSIQRTIVRQALDRGDASAGLALARALAVTTYRSAREFDERFAGPPSLVHGRVRFPVEAYLEHQGRRFVERFEARRYLALSESLDLHGVDPALIRAPVTLVGFEPDSIAPSWLVRETARRLAGPSRFLCVPSTTGHDAFLTDVEAVSAVITTFLSDPELAQ